jgi:hypothetical protein
VIGSRKRVHDVHGVRGVGDPDVELVMHGQQVLLSSSSAGKMFITCCTAVRYSLTGLAKQVFMSSRSFTRTPDDSCVMFTLGFAADSHPYTARRAWPSWMDQACG